MRHSPISILIAGLAAVTVLATGCDQGGSDPSSQEPVSGDEVRVVDNDFEPANLEVIAGDTVTWVWEGRAAHDVVGEDFESDIQEDGTFSHAFEEPGAYDYRCTLHGGMTGRITVTDS